MSVTRLVQDLQTPSTEAHGIGSALDQTRVVKEGTDDAELRCRE
jgi:hypothetical protein